jgi:hypothetical protein
MKIIFLVLFQDLFLNINKKQTKNTIILRNES